MRHLLIIIFALLGLAASAQQAVPYTRQLQQQVAGQGSVVLLQDEEITTLVNNMPVETAPAMAAMPSSGKTTKPASKPASTKPTTTKPTTSSSTSGTVAASSSSTSSSATASSSNSTKPSTSSANGGKRVRHKAQGYRIQVFSGSGNAQAKQAAKAMEAKIRSAFPELSVYCHFKSPRWICRAGDFATREEAQRYLTKFRNQNISAEATIVSDEVFVVK